MGDTRHHDPLKIGHDGFHRLASLGRGRGQGGGNLAFGGLRAHGAVADVLVIIRGPSRNVFAPMLEFVPVHGHVPLLCAHGAEVDPKSIMI